MTTRSKCPGPNLASFLPPVDEVHHRGIGREEDAALARLLGDEVHRRAVGQMRLEGAGGLVHQRGAVGEEQHALDPAGPHQQVDERDHRAGLARAGRHHEQRLALAVGLEALGDRADGALLVGRLSRRWRCSPRLGERLAAGAALDQQLQLVALVEAADASRRIARVVPDPVLVAVGTEDDRAPP